jgi:putative ABC transport system substrate-binding protein
MRRREFITLLGGSAAWPLAARAEQAERVWRIGVLGGYAADDPEVAPRAAALKRGLDALGWSEGRNIRIDYRWAAGDAARMRAYAADLVSQGSDLILTSTTPTLRALQQATRTIPIVFVAISDPVGDGFVASLARPGGNITGFSSHDPAMAGKWLELLKECAPGLERVAIIFNPDTAPHSVYLPLITAAAPVFSVKLITAAVRNAAEIESVIADLGREPGGGLIVMPDVSNVVHRGLIFSRAAQHRVPAIFYRRYFAANGGLMSFGADDVDQHRRAASYMDRIFKGAKPVELPVQAPIKFELVINLKTAKALGLEVPPTLLARADEVIE